MDSHGVAVLLVVGCATGGVLAGAAGRLLLGRLRRGAFVRRGPCETAVSLLWTVAAAAVAFGKAPPWWLPVTLALSWFAVLLTVTDLMHRRLPDALTLPAWPTALLLLGAAAMFGAGPGLALRAAVGSVVFWGVHAAVRLAAPHALGGGDVKLAASLGAVLGALGWPALVLATVLAAVLTLLLRFAGRRRWSAETPHGPGMLGATWLVAVLPGGGALVP